MSVVFCSARSRRALSFAAASSFLPARRYRSRSLFVSSPNVSPIRVKRPRSRSMTSLRVGSTTARANAGCGRVMSTVWPFEPHGVGAQLREVDRRVDRADRTEDGALTGEERRDDVDVVLDVDLHHVRALRGVVVGQVRQLLQQRRLAPVDRCRAERVADREQPGDRADQQEDPDRDGREQRRDNGRRGT